MSTQAEREIIIYATRGGMMKTITTNATTWGELRPLVEREGYDLNKLLAAESFTKHDLINDMALLPIEGFRLFLRPKQTKSGAELSYRELRAAISEIIHTDEEAGKEHFNQGKNYTTKKTAELQELYATWGGGKKAKVAKPVKEVKANPVKEKKAKKVKEVKPVKEKKAKKVKPAKAKKLAKMLESVSDAAVEKEFATEQTSEADSSVLQGAIIALKSVPQSSHIKNAIAFIEKEIEGEPAETLAEQVAREAKSMGY